MKSFEGDCIQLSLCLFLVATAQIINSLPDNERRFCNGDEFSCDGLCFPSSIRCDGLIQCSTGIDEVNCSQSTEAPALETSTSYPNNSQSCPEYKCQNEDLCFSKVDKCNGLNDCSDGYDEQNCTCTGVTVANTCGKYYIEPFFKANWYRATAFCHSLGMKLISIPTAEKHDEIVNIIQKAGYGGNSFWTSATSLGYDEYYWHSTGSALKFTNWAREPERRECMALWSDSYWEDTNCLDHYRIICEKDE